MCLYFTGNKTSGGWKQKENKSDIYFAKGICEKLFKLANIREVTYVPTNNSTGIDAYFNNILLATISIIEKNKLNQFSIKQPVFFADIYWEAITAFVKAGNIIFKPIPKFPVVERDLSITVLKSVTYEIIKETVKNANIIRLNSFKLFDVFESERIGKENRSYALRFTFTDNEKTLTDKEIDIMMNKLIVTFEKQLQAQIRKSNG